MSTFTGINVSSNTGFVGFYWYTLTLHTRYCLEKGFERKTVLKNIASVESQFYRTGKLTHSEQANLTPTGSDQIRDENKFGVELRYLVHEEPAGNSLNFDFFEEIRKL